MKYNELLNESNPSVEIDMGELGVITLELFESVAPITVKNFLDLVETSFYDGLIFHRVIKDFMCQAGGYYIKDGKVQTGLLTETHNVRPVINIKVDGLKADKNRLSGEIGKLMKDGKKEEAEDLTSSAS